MSSEFNDQDLGFLISTLQDVRSGVLTRSEAAGVFKSHGYDDPWGIHKVAEPPPFSPLIGQIFTKMITDWQITSQQLINVLTRRAEIAEATLNTVQNDIVELLGGNWMPTPQALINRLWPDKSRVERHIDEMKDEVD